MHADLTLRESNRRLNWATVVQACMLLGVWCLTEIWAVAFGGDILALVEWVPSLKPLSGNPAVSRTALAFAHLSLAFVLPMGLMLGLHGQLNSRLLRLKKAPLRQRVTLFAGVPALMGPIAYFVYVVPHAVHASYRGRGQVLFECAVTNDLCALLVLTPLCLGLAFLVLAFLLALAGLFFSRDLKVR